MWPRSSSKRSNSTYLGNRLANSSQSTISRTASASTESHSERRFHKKFEMKSRPCFVTFLFLRLSILHSHITIPVSFLLNAYRHVYNADIFWHQAELVWNTRLFFWPCISTGAQLQLDQSVVIFVFLAFLFFFLHILAALIASGGLWTWSLHPLNTW